MFGVVSPDSPGAPVSLGIHPLRLIWNVLYGMLKGTTEMVGVSPLQILIGVGALLGVVLVAQLVMVSSGRQGWHLRDVRSDPEMVARMRAELDGKSTST